MKSADRKLAYSVAVVLAVIAAEIAWFLFVGPTDSRPNYAATCEKNCSEPWWQSVGVWTMIFTGVLTGSTALLWKETRRLAGGAENQLKITQRAYIAVDPDGVRNVLKPENNIICRVAIKNTGHLPARNVRWLITQRFSGDKRLADFPINISAAEGANVVSPGATMIQGGDLYPAMPSEFSAKSGPTDRYLYVWGIVLYDDGIGGFDRKTLFCHRYNCRNLDGREIAARHGRFSRYGNDAD